MSNKHVLLVEDDVLLARMYDKILTHYGFQMLHVDTAEKAIESLYCFDPDVVCLDWQLAQGISQPFLEHVKKLDPNRIPQIALVSGEAWQEDLLLYQDVIQIYLQKPMLARDLVSHVVRLSVRAEAHLPLCAVETIYGEVEATACSV